MTFLLVSSLALMFVVITVLLLIFLKGPLGMHSAFVALDRRMIELERAARTASEATPQAREAKETTFRLESAVGEVHGRLAGLTENQQQMGIHLVKLQSTLPLQVSEGLRAIKDGMSVEQGKLRQEVGERSDANARSVAARIDSGMSSVSEAMGQMRLETANSLKDGGVSLSAKVEELRAATDAKLGEIVTRTSESARSLNDTGQRTIITVTEQLLDLKTAVDAALKEELGSIRAENNVKLEAIRLTVDEKLHATLEQRLGESFKQVSERLEAVHRGLGEMQSLAVGVGDLRKVLTNVKTRGTWGEIQLGALLDQILTTDQYEHNVITRPGGSARVEFAIRLPGRSEDGPVWLPIDAKFPMEDYQRLMDAQERADVIAVEEAGRALESRIKLEARSIRDKYIEPPHTTDFAVLYLPTEGLYAEVLRRAGLADWLQRECKVNLTGPTTLAAMLNSLQMGFRTLAIEKRSSEVWTVLGTVKTEFARFAQALAHTKKKLEEAHSSIESAETRNRVLTRKLKVVDALPLPEAAGLLRKLPASPDANSHVED